MWDAIGIWTGSALWWAMSFWTLVVGLIAALPTIVTGFMEYARLSPDSPAEPMATRHLLLTGAAITAFLVSLLVRGAPDATLQNARLVGALACSGVGGALLAAGGHLGAVLVFRYGVGVSRPGEPSESRPQV